MRKIKLIMFVALAAIPFLQSCNDSKNDFATTRAMSTISISGDDYFFTLDNDDKVFPGDKSYVSGYSLKDKDGNSKDGKRAIIDFTPMEQLIDGYKYNAKMFRIYDILTKPIDIATTEEELTPFGNSPMEIEDAWSGNGWLNILFSISAGGNKSHRISLVDNKTVTQPSDTPTGYKYLEFRHNNDNDMGYEQWGYVSYKLQDEYNPVVDTNIKGFYIKIINFNGNVEYIKISVKSSTGKTLKEYNTASNFSY